MAPWIVLAALATAAPARSQYALMRGNLHAHTDYSDNQDHGDPSTTTPGLAAGQARANGLDVFSTSDHGEYISDANWANTKTQMTQATQPGSFVALWGFEWTASQGVFPRTATGKGHLSVYGSTNQTGLTEDASRKGNGLPQSRWTPDVYWRNVGGTLGHVGTFYQWLTDPANATSPLGGTIVGQFNHPSLYPNAPLANPSSHWTVVGSSIVIQDWWRKLEWVPEADPFMNLMEMSSRASSPPNCQGGAFNEPYFQLALDNGWHVAPTNNEDNHFDSYGASYSFTSTLSGADPVMTSTGIWAATEPANGSKTSAQAKVLSALRERRTFSSEDPAGPHADGTVVKWTVNTVSDGVKWMGARTLKPADVTGNRLHLEVTRAAGLSLQSVQVITNRGVVAKTLPLSGAGVTIAGSKYTWDFGVAEDAPGAQIRACSDVEPPLAAGAYTRPPLPSPSDTSSLGVVLNAAASSHIERYYYIRVVSTSAIQPYYAFSAPIWIARAAKTPVSYHWDFGDGSTLLETPPTTPDTPFGEKRHVYPKAGTWYPRVTVNYSDGTSETALTRVVLGSKTTDPLYGDVNGDGQVNAQDLQLLARASAGVQSLADAGQFTRANVHPPASGGQDPGKNSSLDISDVLRLSRFLNGAAGVWP
jgi:hypothetical protein